MSDTRTSVCCDNPPQSDLARPEPAVPCCGTSAEARQADACCGAAAKQEAVKSGQGCCG